MAEKANYPQMPAGQVPPPYGPHDPPPAYTLGPYAGAPEGYQPGPPPPGIVTAAPGYQHVPPPPGVTGAPGLSPTVVTVVKMGARWSPYPVMVVCPQCSARVMTETTASPGLLTWLLSGLFVFMGCWLGCCLIPCCIPECQDIEHRCPNCKAHLGIYRRI